MFAASLFVMGIFLPLFQSFRLFQSYLNGIEDFKNLAIFSAVLAIFPAAMIAASMAIFDSPLLFILVNFTTTFLVTLILFLISIRLHRPQREKIDPTANHESKHMSFMMYLGSLSQQLDQVITFQFLGPATLATYNFALAPANQLSLITNIITPLTAPRMAKNSFTAIKKSILNKVILLTIISSLIYVVYFFSAPLIFKYLFPAYEEAVVYTRALALIIFFSPTFLFQQAFSSHSKIKELYIIKTLVPIFKIITIISFTFIFGLPGLITSVVATYAFRYLLYALMMKVMR